MSTFGRNAIDYTRVGLALLGEIYMGLRAFHQFVMGDRVWLFSLLACFMCAILAYCGIDESLPVDYPKDNQGTNKS